jgi:glycosyltransferase involved in cell wall biosynthesis
MDNNMQPKKILYLITEDWYFCQHFLDLAIYSINAGYHVSVLCRIGQKGSAHSKRITSSNISLYPVSMERGSVNVFSELNTIKKIIKIYRKVDPDIVHHIAIKPIIYGQIAAKYLGIKARVNLIPGFGHIYSSKTLKAFLLRPLISFTISRLIYKSKGIVVMNEDDRRLISSLSGVEINDITIVHGTGVDSKKFKYKKESANCMTVTYLGRFLYDKGLSELYQSAKILNNRGISVNIRIVGEADKSSANSVSSRDLKLWTESGLIQALPWTDDVYKIWCDTNIAILPSYREGFGMSLAEAATVGRALIATNVPGCREVVKDKITGLLVSECDPILIADAIELLVKNKAMRERFADAAHNDAMQRMSTDKINKSYLLLYKKIL